MTRVRESAAPYGAFCDCWLGGQLASSLLARTSLEGVRKLTGVAMLATPWAQRQIRSW